MTDVRNNPATSGFFAVPPPDTRSGHVSISLTVHLPRASGHCFCEAVLPYVVAADAPTDEYAVTMACTRCGRTWQLDNSGCMTDHTDPRYVKLPPPIS